MMVPGLVSDRIAHVTGTKRNTADQCEAVVLPAKLSSQSELQATSVDELHDMVCVGFGPASLAIAVALHDKLDLSRGFATPEPFPKVRFLERQFTFEWHAGMLLPGAKMQISFIKDLATLRDPCSHFTFLNYLKEHNRLVQFTNLGTFLPSRLEFADYMKWAATQFSNVIDYGQEVLSVHPVKAQKGLKIRGWEVKSRNVRSREVTTLLSRNVVIAVGGKAAIPEPFPNSHPLILHTSQYSTRIAQILPDKDKTYSIAVIGGGQSAAEVFNDLQSRYPNSRAKLIIRDTALRPSDDSPFVNEVFDPEAVDAFYEQPAELRGQMIKKNKATNYSVVRLELLEKIYEHQYTQSIRQSDRSKWRHQILTSREIVSVVDVPGRRQVLLTLNSLATKSSDTNTDAQTIDVDAVILGTGYHRDAHVDMLRACESLRDDSVKRTSSEAEPLRGDCWTPERNYQLKLDRTKVADDVGIWLQGCNEGTHGLSDSLLSILATRSGELVQSIFGDKMKGSSAAAATMAKSDMNGHHHHH